MRRDFQAALARVQRDYAFYIHCQLDPATALTGYSLSPEEQATFRDPQRLADALQERTSMRLPSITIKISGTHDWINAAATSNREDIDEVIAHAVESVKRSENVDERRDSTLRLMRLIG
ncbi:hypothetical protein ACIRP3_43230 [Streptomyces sp. NPDC101209]|uniref:hypothetical protein n=1 Tax=Streptomyces sp. NPDC101209 TaxID=3366129 RepID=UPI00380B4FAB